LEIKKALRGGMLDSFSAPEQFFVKSLDGNRIKVMHKGGGGNRTFSAEVVLNRDGNLDFLEDSVRRD
jgi:hypothetical protein